VNAEEAVNQKEKQIPGIRPYFEMDGKALQAIADVLESGNASNNGPHLRNFEKALATYLGADEVAVVSNGSDGLLLALKALELRPGKAILPAYTYIATLNAVIQGGLEPIFCDIDPRTFTMDVGHVAQLMERHRDVRCVIPVNAFGVHADLPAVRTLCDRHGAALLYDNAHGFGSELNRQRFPTEPDVQVFSFHATKTLPAVEGGAVLSANAALMATVKQLRNHGLAPNPLESSPGFNSKMDEIRAIIGANSLVHFPEALARRRSYALRLRKAFQSFDDVYENQFIPPNLDSNFQNLSVLCPAARKLGLTHVLELFRSEGVGVRAYFDPPMHKIRGFDKAPSLPATEMVWQTLVSVPIHSRMSEEVLAHIEAAVSQVATALRGTT
jgi:dTDP-4-amino-4,6-dideoxygalactose transaminase